MVGTDIARLNRYEEHDPLLEQACELSVVVPTFNERDNVGPLVDRLNRSLAGVAWQAIFVDDHSPDGTAAVIKSMAVHDPRLLCLERVGRRGLAGAVVEGAMASAAPFVAVIDADLQHDETLLPRMLARLRAGDADVAVGSRFLGPDGLGPGSPVEGLSPLRRWGSRVANALARQVLKARVSDPVSGFFMIRRELIEAVAPRLSVQGFKVLFDIIASQPTPPRIIELPYAFAERTAGASKMDGRIVLDYLGLILAKLTGNLVSPRFLMFALVGASGVAVHMAVLYGARTASFGFFASQSIAAVTAMTSNFLINNRVTYRDRRLRGLSLVTGYLRFCALCALGLVANISIANLVHEHTPLWWLAGASGAVAGAAWNYVSTSLAVW
jgi:dolichol-phosphate mannosyltransferase